jgi:hypothetical protein
MKLAIQILTHRRNCLSCYRIVSSIPAIKYRQGLGVRSRVIQLYFESWFQYVEYIQHTNFIYTNELQELDTVDGPAVFAMAWW